MSGRRAEETNVGNKIKRHLTCVYDDDCRCCLKVEMMLGLNVNKMCVRLILWRKWAAGRNWQREREREQQVAIITAQEPPPPTQPQPFPRDELILLSPSIYLVITLHTHLHYCHLMQQEYICNNMYTDVSPWSTFICRTIVYGQLHIIGIVYVTVRCLLFEYEITIESAWCYGV